MLIFFSAFDILTTSEFPQRRCKRKFLPHPCLQLQWPRGPSGWCVGRRGQLEWTRVGGVTFLGKVKPQRVSLPPSASFSFPASKSYDWKGVHEGLRRGEEREPGDAQATAETWEPPAPNIRNAIHTCLHTIRVS